MPAVEGIADIEHSQIEGLLLDPFRKLLVQGTSSADPVKIGQPVAILITRQNASIVRRRIPGRRVDPVEMACKRRDGLGHGEIYVKRQ